MLIRFMKSFYEVVLWNGNKILALPDHEYRHTLLQAMTRVAR